MVKKCVSEPILEVLGRKWVLLILRALELDKRKRFNELSKELKVSPRTLSKRVDELEELGIIGKESFDEIPPRVEYFLTQKGKDLVRSFVLLDRWIKKYEWSSVIKKASYSLKDSKTRKRLRRG